MIELPIAAKPISAAAQIKPGAGKSTNSRAAVAEDVDAATSTFRDALAVELGQGEDTAVLSNPASVAIAPAKLYRTLPGATPVDAQTDDPAQTAAEMTDPNTQAEIQIAFPPGMVLPGIAHVSASLEAAATHAAPAALLAKSVHKDLPASSATPAGKPNASRAATAAEFAAAGRIDPTTAGNGSQAAEFAARGKIDLHDSRALAQAADFTARGKGDPHDSRILAQVTDLTARGKTAARTSGEWPQAAEAAALGKDAPAAASEMQRATEFFARMPDQSASLQAAHAMSALGAAAPNSVPSNAAAAVAATLTIDPQVGDKGWDRALGEKMVWMTGQQKQTAELHLNPPELGPLKITITLNDDQASAQFVSAHAQVREAIEGAMPRLREMLADSGISLGNASVSSEAFREPQQDPRSHGAASPALTQDAPALQRGERQLRSALGLVDTFA